MPIYYNQVQHFRARIHLHRSEPDLAAKSLISAEQQLLPRLPPRIECSRDLRPAKGSIRQQTAIFAGEGNPLGDALVDNIYAHLRQAVNVGLARAKVAAFYRVVEKAIDAVTVVGVILSGIN